MEQYDEKFLQEEENNIYIYYWLMNKMVLDMYYKKYIINNNDVNKYFTLIANTFRYIFKKYINNEYKQKEKLEYSKLEEYIKANIEKFNEIINSEYFGFKYPPYIQKTHESIEFKKEYIKIENNINININKNEITKDTKPIENENTNNNMEIEDNEKQQDNNKNEINIKNNIPQKKRLYIFKTKTKTDKDKIINQIKKSYQQKDEALLIVHREGKKIIDYYITVNFRNPILFPFKGYEEYEYNERSTSNNHIKNDLIKLGDCYKIDLNN